MARNSFRVIETPRFKEEAQLLREEGAGRAIAMLIKKLRRMPYFGQQLLSGEERVWAVQRGGFAYIAYYSIDGSSVTLESVIKRKTPIAPGPLGIEP
jgi:hypothetical protein